MTLRTRPLFMCSAASVDGGRFRVELGITFLVVQRTYLLRNQSHQEYLDRCYKHERTHISKSVK